MKVNRVLVGTLALVLIAGLGIPAFAIDDGLTGTPGPPVAAPFFATNQVGITFDACPAGSMTSYSEAGATMTGVGGGMFICDFQSPDASNSLVNTETPREETRVDFPGLVSQVSVDLGDFGADPDLLFIEAFNSADVSVDFTSLLFPVGFTGMETLTVSGPDIAYIITGSRPPSDNGASVAIDNIIFTPQITVGGELLPIDSTALMLAGLQSSAIWMLPILAGAAGVGAFYIKTRMNKK